MGVGMIAYTIIIGSCFFGVLIASLVASAILG